LHVVAIVRPFALLATAQEREQAAHTSTARLVRLAELQD
jgi:hypothetical protein